VVVDGVETLVIGGEVFYAEGEEFTVKQGQGTDKEKRVEEVEMVGSHVIAPVSFLIFPAALIGQVF
jgi:hypothetical protein